MNNRGLIPLSALVVAGTLTFAEIQSKDRAPTTKQFLGLAVVYMGISIASDMGFQPASGFALLLMVSAFVSRGYEAIEYLTGKAGSPKQKKLNAKQKQRILGNLNQPPQTSLEPLENLHESRA